MRLIKFLAVASLIACGGGGDSSTAPQNASVVGAWNLSTTNGKTLPANVNGYEEVMNGQLNFSVAGTYTSQYQYHPTGSTSTRTSSESGTWTQTGNTVSFNSNGTYTGTLSDGKLIVSESGELWAYVRQ